jgi:hypothetical protein
MTNTIHDFWNSVDIKGEDECWPFLGYCNKKGYGQFRLNGKLRPPHIISFEATNIRRSKGSIIMHSCNNPPCCNPKHLVEGTYAENAQYSVKCGRASIASNTSGVMGVSCEKGYWTAKGQLNGKIYRLYHGHNFIEACNARKLWEVKNLTVVNSVEVSL